MYGVWLAVTVVTMVTGNISNEDMRVKQCC